MKVVVTKKSFSRKQTLKNKAKQYIIFVGLSASSISMFLWGIQRLIKDDKWLDVNSMLIVISITLGAIISLVMAWLIKRFDYFFDKLDVKIGIAMAGDQGERMVYDELNKILDSLPTGRQAASPRQTRGRSRE